MKKISDFNSATDKYPVVYAGMATKPEYVDMPTILQQQEGVAPLDTCPAQWWNAMWKLATQDINAFRDFVGDAFTEINNLLTKFGITLDDADSEQLYDFFHDDYVQNYLTTVLSSVFVNKSGDTINGDLHIKGNLSVDGIVEEVISTELNVGSNIITLRNGNPSSLGNTELAGILTENYDGNNNNNIIAINKNGIVRTGDINIATRVLYSSDGTVFFTDKELTVRATIGATEQVRDTGNQISSGVKIYEGITYSNDDTQALATRDDNLTDNQLVKWDGTTKKLVSTNDYATNTSLIDERNRATSAETSLANTKNSNITINDSSAKITDSSAFLEGSKGTNPNSFLRHSFSKVWEYIKSKADSVYAKLSHTHTKSQITDFPTALKNPNALTVNGKTYDGSAAVNAGTQTIANGGTGATTAKGAEYNLVIPTQNATIDAEAITDDSRWTGTYNSPSTTNGRLYTKKFNVVWDYIKGKISKVLGLTATAYGGKASTAGTADKATSDGSGNNIVNTYATIGNTKKWSSVYSGQTSSGYFLLATYTGTAIASNHDVCFAGVCQIDNVGARYEQRFLVYARGNANTIQNKQFTVQYTGGFTESQFLYATCSTANNAFTINLYGKIARNYIRFNTCIDYASDSDVSVRIGVNNVSMPNTYSTTISGTEITYQAIGAPTATNASNSNALEGKTWRETALAGIYITDDTSNLDVNTYTFTANAPVGSTALDRGSTVKVTFANSLQSSKQIESVFFSYGGRTGKIVAARGGSFYNVTSHLFQTGKFSHSYPNKVWDSYTALELMWVGSYWLVMGDTVLCSYFSNSESDNYSNYIIKANGLIINSFTFNGTGTYSFPVTFSNNNYKVIGGASLISSTAERVCSKKVNKIIITCPNTFWDVEDMFVIGY